MSAKRKSAKRDETILAIKMRNSLRKKIKAAADAREQTESQFARFELGRAADEIITPAKP